MAVYVDNFYEVTGRNFGRMKMCHMIADTHEELLQMVDKIGVQRKWIQYPGTANEHFDICLSKRKIAVKHGAVEINFRRYAEMVNEKKDKDLKDAMSEDISRSGNESGNNFIKTEIQYKGQNTNYE